MNMAFNLGQIEVGKNLGQIKVAKKNLGQIIFITSPGQTQVKQA
jgi:hypothetical protein